MKAIRILPVLAAAALFGAAPPASARAPSTADQGSLDWLLLRFAKDREEEMTGGGVVDEVVAFQRGDIPLEGDGGWKKMLAIVNGPDKQTRREQAAQAVVDRLKLEEDRKAIDPKTLADIRKQVCRETLKPMLGSNSGILICIFKIQRAFLISEWVTWSPSDSLTKRRDAYKKLSERLK